MGIDIGLKNFAYCLLDDNREIVEWECVDLTKEIKGSKHYSGKFDMIHVSKTLYQIFEPLMEKYDFKVNIENQIPTGSNGITMKTIQGMTTQILTMKGIEVKYVSGRKKLKGYDVPQKTYKERKASSVKVVLGQTVCLSSKYSGLKLDDMCDAYLLAGLKA